ncbi:MAG: hemolysin family protein [Buchananella hordeovulneris]|nr:hemolysin family protein [Buchananella hordeovulneris]
MNPTLLFVIAGVLYLISALYTAVRPALERLSRVQVEEAQTAGLRGAEHLDYFVEERARAQSGAAATQYLCETTATVALTLGFATFLPTWWATALVSMAVILTVVGLVAALGLARWGRNEPATVARRLAVLIRVPAAFVGWISGLTQGMERINPPPTTEAEAREEMADDLRDLVDRVGEAEGFEDEDREMLRSVFELGQTLAHEVMVPRPDLVTIPQDAPLRKAMNLFVRSGFSRVPVLDQADDVAGILYFKDVVQRLHYHQGAQEEPVSALAREAFFVPEFVRADDLLRQMQAASNHIAVLVDEYGGVAGLVTIEDLLEELVGEMTDEHDRAEPEVEELGEGRWRVPARLPIAELGELFGLDIDDDDVETVGGLLTKALGRIPLPGASADILGVHLEAERIGGRRHQLLSLLASKAEEDEDAVPERR